MAEHTNILNVTNMISNNKDNKVPLTVLKRWVDSQIVDGYDLINLDVYIERSSRQVDEVFLRAPKF